MRNIQNLKSRITLLPEIMVGKPTIRGLRISVEQILLALARGISEEELLIEYPELEREDFHAIYNYVADLVTSEKVFPISTAG